MKLNPYLNFDGNDHLDWGKLTRVENLSQVTYEFWLKPNEFTLYNPLFNNADTRPSLSQYSRFSLGYLSDGKFSVFFANASDKRLSLNTDTSLVLNEWHHIVCVFDGTNPSPTNKFSIYFNGILQPLTYSQTTNLTTVPGNNRVTIKLGKTTSSDSSSNYPKLDFNVLRVYSSVLDASEVLKNYNATKHRFN